ncbi:SDR family NAD(P)-dependent oxidoreductase [Acuticoccus sp. I52.16.1]|uniref:SDR family NAD(P)-dependent oxidoreductase n=1 Tax=Acuticoccus sp. I52.16.1 TaxID=2928472 RepID=UPI001FD321B2|nr:SDR family NAD(P)-dependent oxidoreductase [Acuticoccus sp. I52.16.1]UOM33249.1 SDR family oxidoreductase [Acuticoccus sp. I52.16.1]
MNKIDLEGRVAAVTGGAQGIGLAVAKRLAAGGAKVSIWDRDEKLGKAAAAELGCDFRSLEQTDELAVSSVVKSVESDLGAVDVLIACAGIAGANAPVKDYDPAEWRRIIDINLNGVFYLNRAVVPGMIARNYGRIVNVASIAGKEGNPNASAYSASKAGVVALTKSLGKELAGHDIGVNCVTPAAARTRIFDQMKQEHIDYMLSKIPRNRFLEVDEAAAMIAWLASADNSFTTGAVFDLSGGRATY